MAPRVEVAFLTACVVVFCYLLARDLSTVHVVALSATTNGVTLDVRLPWWVVDATFLVLDLRRLCRLLRRGAETFE